MNKVGIEMRLKRLINLNLLSVCAKPIYIEAREVITKKYWTGSNSTLIYQVKETGKWAYGLSKDFG